MYVLLIIFVQNEGGLFVPLSLTLYFASVKVVQINETTKLF
jgi:hypothetical protein